MRKLAVALLGGALLFAGPTASARPSQPTIEGRHDVLRAAMYAGVLDTGKPIQILDRLCPTPGKPTGCEPVSASLREAVDDALGAPIRWVGRERRKAGTFFELGRVVRIGDKAHFDFRWDDPRPYGCYGGGRLIFHRVDWTGWKESGGYGFGGCPSAGSGGGS
ncbi:MAG: hypothetical protein ACJ76P_05005 [Actinomycetota bacterium]